jgi:2,3-bisphosphoglycerate-independent phosphoglycerate mutase
MKKVVVIIDGLGDLPCKQLGNKTPLEAADTPNLDELTKKGQLGRMYPINEDYAPESDTAVLAILGNKEILTARGQFEALGLNIKLNRGDLALRANFGTVDNLKNRRMIDRRAGRTLTTREARQLAKAINKQVKLPVKFEFYPTLQHRGVLVLRGGFSDNITNTDTYQHEKGRIWVKEKFNWSKALDEDENTEFTANLVNAFVDGSFKVLSKHPINLIRRKRGLMPANIILTRGAGVETPKLKRFRHAMAVVNMPLEKGICKASGMDVYDFRYPKMRGYDVYENLYHGIEKMIKFSIKMLKRKRKRYDLCYIHIKETDVPGHDNKPFEKKNFIEIIDKKLFSFLKNHAEKYGMKIIVTGDHSTPCNMKTHTAHPLPILLYDKSQKPDKTDAFSELQSKNGALGKILGKNLLKKTGFSY